MLILFDIDDTLIDHGAAFRAAAAALYDEVGPGVPYESFFGKWSAAQRRNFASWRLFDDVLPCLDALTGHRLGVVSNGQSRQQRAKLASLEPDATAARSAGLIGVWLDRQRTCTPEHAAPVVPTLAELPALVGRAIGGRSGEVEGGADE